MILDYLGHSEFLATLKNARGEDVSILSDSWLSNYVFGDLMGRNPTFNLDYTFLKKIDAIFISHSHCDHLDPYTLIELYKNFENSPILLLPEVLLFMKEIFEKYLPDTKIIVMKNREKYEINGIFVRGYIFENDTITNEDDVMSLFISNEHEIVYTEVDTIPPMNDTTQNFLYKIFTERSYESVVYLATRNELEGNLKLPDFENIKERTNFAKDYIHTRKEEIEFDYSKFEEGADFKDIYRIKNFIRIFIGQGITFPKALNKEFLKLRVMTLEEEKNIEKTIAGQYNYHFPIEFFEAGSRYEIEKGKMKKVWAIPYLKDFEFLNPTPDITTNIVRPYANWSLSKEERNIETQKKIILELLNNRFIPFWLGNPDDNLKNLILKNENKKYTIKVTFWTKEKSEIVYYTIDFGQFTFTEWESRNGYFDEDYWANDLEDFYEGKQELYSNFLHKLQPNKSYRLWTTLGANFLNNDLLIKKYSFHFEQALKWEKVDNFVLPYYKNL